MAALPFINDLKVEKNISWAIETKKVTMETGATYLSLTQGFNPYVETATITWLVDATEAASLLTTLKAGKLNAVYDYTCPVRGALRIRPTGSLNFNEPLGLKLQVSVGFRVV